MILVLLFLSFYFIDINRIRNNKPILFSTWGFDYIPPVNLNEEKIERTIRDYLLMQSKNESRNLNNEKSFISIKTYLIHEADNNTTVVYLWALEKTYYEENEKILKIVHHQYLISLH